MAKKPWTMRKRTPRPNAKLHNNQDTLRGLESHILQFITLQLIWNDSFQKKIWTEKKNQNYKIFTNIYKLERSDWRRMTPSVLHMPYILSTHEPLLMPNPFNRVGRITISDSIAPSSLIVRNFYYSQCLINAKVNRKSIEA